ncbi:MAG: TonB-dependent receptor [Bacteroidales bacterium]|nr:TonB-dependent receptor [Bacteroidales bacterium]
MLCGAVSVFTAPDAVAAPSSQGQGQVTVTGVVLDDMDIPIAGAYVLVRRSSRGVLTDPDGRFSIDVKPGEWLIFQFLGFEDVEVKVGDERNLTIHMRSQASALDEATVVAYGTQRKASVIGAITTIDTQNLKVPVGQVSSSLAGKMAGLVVLQRTGEPGAGADFWIRGISTFGSSNNKPLILVDGMERSLDLVDVDDIASFSILKDASATAVYGVKGANGIVIVTTKRGSESAPKVNLKVELGLTQPVKIPQMANASQWIDFYNAVNLDSGAIEAPISDYQKGMYMLQPGDPNYDPDLYPNVDWVKTIYKNLANTQRYQVSVTGGTKMVRYYVGGSYYRENSILNPAQNKRYDASLNFNRFSFRANTDINITRSTELGLSLSTQYTIKNTPASDLGNIYTYTLLMTPIAIPTIFSDGTYSRGLVGQNPYNDLNHVGYRANNQITAQSLISLTQHFDDFADWLQGLNLNIKFAWDAWTSTTLTRSIYPTIYEATGRQTERDPESNFGDARDYPLIKHQLQEGSDYMSLYTGHSSNMTIEGNASLNYERLFNEAHRVSGLLLFSIRNFQNNTPGGYLYAFPYRYIGLAGRASYSYKDRYFIEGNFGYNGSENFAPAHRFGFFPSIAVGYMISNERFWEPIKDVVNTVKFKASYGLVGNGDIGGTRFAFNTTLNTGAAGFSFGENGKKTWYTGISTAQRGDESVGWETARKLNVGIETRFFNQLSVNFDYFRELRDGIYVARQSIPSVVGENTDQYANIGRLQNQGIEVNVEYEKTFFKELYVSARGNFSYNRNQKLYDDIAAQLWEYQNTFGYTVYQQRGLIAEGLFESQDDIDTWPKQTFGDVRPGDIKYRDVNGDGVVDQFDIVPIGFTHVPEINYGFGLSLGWKGIDASVFFSGVANYTRFINGANLYGASTNMVQLGQIYADVAENRWMPGVNENPNAPYPRLATNKVENNQVNVTMDGQAALSTFWQRDMGFMRLKNAEIGYTLPKRITRKIGLSTVRFYLQGVNLLTFSKFKLWDPELAASNGNIYPQMRTYSFGINLNF